MLRTPLLPFDALLSWSRDVQYPVANAAGLAAAVAADRALLRRRLSAVLEQKPVLEALFVASPGLEEGLVEWRANPDGEKGAKIERALVRYFARMAGRATPFGLFAGCAVGRTGEKTHLEVPTLANCSRKTRPDMYYLSAVTDALVQEPAVAREVLYRPNSSLYRCGSGWRYAEASFDNTVRKYQLVSIEATPALELAIQKAGLGIRAQALAETLAASFAVDLTEARAFVGELVASGILEADFGPSVTGEEPLPTLLQDLEKFPGAGAAAGILRDLSRDLAALDGGGVGAAPEQYRQIARRLDALPVPVELPRLFQVDLMKPAPQATLGENVLAELARGTRLLRRLCGTVGDARLSKFRQAFVARYDSREVPLAEALDGDTGVEFGGVDLSSKAVPLLATLAFPSEPDRSVACTPEQAILLRKVSEALHLGKVELEISEDDFPSRAEDELPALPTLFSAIAVVGARSPSELEQGQFRVLLEGAPAGARLFGRFCHPDPELRDQVEELLRLEQAQFPADLLAEIAHLPQGRLGNILCRPCLRQHEIEYLGRSGAPKQDRIALEDLRLSVRGGRLVLRSARLDREIRPRLTNAHGFEMADLPLYSFLASLEYQDVALLMFDPGPLRELRHAPRIVCGKVVVAPARWNLRSEWKSLSTLKGVALLAEVRRLKEEEGLPRFVAVVQGDKVLPVDLHNVLSVESFAQLVSQLDDLVLIEVWPGPDELCASGLEGRFVHEIIVPFIAPREAPKGRPAPRLHAAAAPVRRSTPPGGDWLYAKLYCSPATADHVLREAIAPVVEEAQSAGDVDRWFFVRYDEAGWHLRVRLHGSPERLHSRVFPHLRRRVWPLLDGGMVSRFQLDTYEREIERYGGDEGMLLSEALFHADSEAALRICLQLSGDEGARARWQLALRAMKDLLDDLNLTGEAQARLTRSLRAGFGREFGDRGQLERQLGGRYREMRKEIRDLLEPKAQPPDWIEPGIAILRDRSRKLGATCTELRKAELEGRLTATVETLAESYLHMSANRLLLSAARAQELVLYDFLERHLSSEEARRRKGATAVSKRAGVQG
ncbi:MAG TPA: lantibiotic dehydratase [Myxococcales bacterium]